MRLPLRARFSLEAEIGGFESECVWLGAVSAGCAGRVVLCAVLWAAMLGRLRGAVGASARKEDWRLPAGGRLAPGVAMK